MNQHQLYALVANTIQQISAAPFNPQIYERLSRQWYQYRYYRQSWRIQVLGKHFIPVMLQETRDPRVPSVPNMQRSSELQKNDNDQQNDKKIQNLDENNGLSIKKTEPQMNEINSIGSRDLTNSKGQKDTFPKILSEHIGTQVDFSSSQSSQPKQNNQSSLIFKNEELSNNNQVPKKKVRFSEYVENDDKQISLLNEPSSQQQLKQPILPSTKENENKLSSQTSNQYQNQTNELKLREIPIEKRLKGMNITTNSSPQTQSQAVEPKNKSTKLHNIAVQTVNIDSQASVHRDAYLKAAEKRRVRQLESQVFQQSQLIDSLKRELNTIYSERHNNSS